MRTDETYGASYTVRAPNLLEPIAAAGIGRCAEHGES